MWTSYDIYTSPASKLSFLKSHKGFLDNTDLSYTTTLDEILSKINNEWITESKVIFFRPSAEGTNSKRRKEEEICCQVY